MRQKHVHIRCRRTYSNWIASICLANAAKYIEKNSVSCPSILSVYSCEWNVLTARCLLTFIKWKKFILLPLNVLPILSYTSSVIDRRVLSSTRTMGHFISDCAIRTLKSSLVYILFWNRTACAENIFPKTNILERKTKIDKNCKYTEERNWKQIRMFAPVKFCYQHQKFNDYEKSSRCLWDFTGFIPYILPIKVK